jgi:AraC family transcriptional regulator
VVDWFLVPATAEPLISCGIAGSAEFREREELEIVQVHVAVEPFLAALKAVYGDKADEVEVIDFAMEFPRTAPLCAPPLRAAQGQRRRLES